MISESLVESSLAEFGLPGMPQWLRKCPMERGRDGGKKEGREEEKKKEGR